MATSDDKSSDTSRDASSDERWVSYGELARLRGIDRASAFKLTLRNKWRRQKDNKGKVTVLVPSDWLTSSRDQSRDPSDDTSDDISRMSAAFQAAVATLREQLAREGARADRAESKADGLELRLADVTDRLREMERTADQARAAAQNVQQAAVADRLADGAARARRYLARLVTALRG